MSLKTGIEIAVHISYLHLKELHKIGWVQYRIAIHYSVKDSPQKIYFMPCNIDNSLRLVHQHHNEPEMDQISCWSQKHQVNYLNDPFPDKTTYYFKGYPDLALLNQISLNITIELLFSESPKAKPQRLHSFNARIARLSGLFEYLPCDFDHFGTLCMAGTYNSSLMEFKFQKNQEQSEFLGEEFPSLTAYLNSHTSSYRYGQTVRFYNGYRDQLEQELRVIQERFNEYSKMLLNQTKQSAYSKLSQNKKIFGLLRKIKEQGKLLAEEEVKLTQYFLQDVLNIKALIYLNWNEFNELVKNNSCKVVKTLKTSYEDKMKERLKVNIFSHNIKNHDWTFNRYGDNSKNHLEQVEIMRKINESEPNIWTSSFPIQNINYFQNSQQAVRIFEQVYQVSNHAPKTVPKDHQHIIFLVHGYQAHRNDFIDFKLSLQAKTKAKVYISCANIGKTEDSLEEMGKRLAIQVTKYLEIQKKPYKISFIGHSMGGIIIRSAIPHLQHIFNHLHSYISLCTPHLGYLYQSTALVQAGLWFLNAFEKCESMLQLTMQDRTDLRDTFLYKLAHNGSLDKFQKIAFICSSQDQYVSYSSARVEKDTTLLNDELKDREEKDIICKMVDKLVGAVQAPQISRIDVIFNISNSNFDSFIGRTGHIKFLCDPHFLKLFTLGLDHLLK